MRVYHFVNKKYGLEDLREKRLKIARINELNDPFELMGVVLTDPEHRESLEFLKTSIGNVHGILCFSKCWNNPLQWAHYADNHKGVCLGFDIPDNILFKVRYQDNPLPADELDALKASVDAQIEVVNLRSTERNGQNRNNMPFGEKILTTKFSHWRYEEEYRFFPRLNRQNQELQYCNFSSDLNLREIIVGIRSTVKRAKVEEALGDTTKGLKIFKVRANYCDFTVVPDCSSSF